MIIKLSEETCANRGCKQKLNNGANIGGWIGKRTPEGNYTSGYTCKKCGNQSVPGTSQLRLYQQNQNFTTPQPSSYHNLTNKSIGHKREWSKLISNIQKDEEQTNAPQNGKMPTWNQVINGMEQKRQEGKAE